MNYRTGGNYGVNEAILASAIAALAFSLFSVQPLTIVGVTGLINLYVRYINASARLLIHFYTQFQLYHVRHFAANRSRDQLLAVPGLDPDVSFETYLGCMRWRLMLKPSWSAITHWLVAIFNVCDFTRFITDTTSETFGFYVGIIYIQKGIELLILEFQVSSTAGWFSVVVATVFALFVYFLERVGTLPFGPLWFRKLVTDYAFALAIVLFTGTLYAPCLFEVLLTSSLAIRSRSHVFAPAMINLKAMR